MVLPIDGAKYINDKQICAVGLRCNFIAIADDVNQMLGTIFYAEQVKKERYNLR